MVFPPREREIQTVGRRYFEYLGSDDSRGAKVGCIGEMEGQLAAAALRVIQSYDFDLRYIQSSLLGKGFMGATTDASV